MKKYIGLIALLSFGCMKKPDSTAVAAPSRYLYLATGQCYSGGNTTFTTATASNLLFRIDTATGLKDLTIADYNAFPASAGDSPVGVVDQDSSNLLVLIENSTSGRRIEKMAKSAASSRSIFTANTTVLSGVLRNMTKLTDGSLLISKSNSIEKLTPTGVRIGIPLITSSLGATCGATITQMTSMLALNNGKILFSHAAAANNRFGLISAGGYSIAADCISAQAAPIATAFPVATAYVSSVNQLIVAYAGNATTTNINSIYVYDINETTGAVTNATRLYDVSLYPSTYNYLLYGISAMTYDPADGSLYVSTAINTATTVANYAIEKFSYDPVGRSLSRIGAPFYNYGTDTKCISSMSIGL